MKSLIALFRAKRRLIAVTFSVATLSVVTSIFMNQNPAIAPLIQTNTLDPYCYNNAPLNQKNYRCNNFACNPGPIQDSDTFAGAYNTYYHGYSKVYFNSGIPGSWCDRYSSNLDATPYSSNMTPETDPFQIRFNDHKNAAKLHEAIPVIYEQNYVTNYPAFYQTGGYNSGNPGSPNQYSGFYAQAIVKCPAGARVVDHTTFGATVSRAHLLNQNENRGEYDGEGHKWCELNGAAVAPIIGLPDDVSMLPEIGGSWARVYPFKFPDGSVHYKYYKSNYLRDNNNNYLSMDTTWVKCENGLEGPYIFGQNQYYGQYSTPKDEEKRPFYRCLRVDRANFIEPVIDSSTLSAPYNTINISNFKISTNTCAAGDASCGGSDTIGLVTSPCSSGTYWCQTKSAQFRYCSSTPDCTGKFDAPATTYLLEPQDFTAPDPIKVSYPSRFNFTLYQKIDNSLLNNTTDSITFDVLENGNPINWCTASNATAFMIAKYDTSQAKGASILNFTLNCTAALDQIGPHNLQLRGRSANNQKIEGMDGYFSTNIKLTVALKNNGETCTSEKECSSNKCIQNTCSPAKKTAEFCSMNWECETAICYNNKCVTEYPRIPICGDNKCESPETYQSCLADCPAPPPPPLNPSSTGSGSTVSTGSGTLGGSGNTTNTTGSGTSRTNTGSGAITAGNSANTSTGNGTYTSSTGSGTNTNSNTSTNSDNITLPPITPPSLICLPVITLAYDPKTSACRSFGSSCIESGWEKLPPEKICQNGRIAEISSLESASDFNKIINEDQEFLKNQQYIFTDLTFETAEINNIRGLISQSLATLNDIKKSLPASTPEIQRTLNQRLDELHRTNFIEINKAENTLKPYFELATLEKSLAPTILSAKSQIENTQNSENEYSKNIKKIINQLENLFKKAGIANLNEIAAILDAIHSQNKALNELNSAENTRRSSGFLDETIAKLYQDLERFNKIKSEKSIQDPKINHGLVRFEDFVKILRARQENGSGPERIKTINEALSLRNRLEDWFTVYGVSTNTEEDISDTESLDKLLENKIEKTVLTEVKTMFDKFENKLEVMLDEQMQKITIQLADVTKKFEGLTLATNDIVRSMDNLTLVSEKHRSKILDSKNAILSEIAANESIIKSQNLSAALSKKLQEILAVSATINWCASLGDEVRSLINGATLSLKNNDLKNTDLNALNDKINELAAKNNEECFRIGASNFRDTPMHLWYFGPAQYNYQNGYILGYFDKDGKRLGQLGAANPTLRIEALTMMMRLFEVPISANSTQLESPIPGVPIWGFPYVNGALQDKIPFNQILPMDQPITRIETAQLITSFMKAKKASYFQMPTTVTKAKNYLDFAEFSNNPDAALSIEALTEIDILKGSDDGRLYPYQNLLRSEYATLIQRIGKLRQ